MKTEDQSEVIAWLASPDTHGGAPVSVIETHASVVFLAGGRALKLKRAVRYDYLDFSSVERLRAMCEAEVCINRRTTPELYRGVMAITREADGALALGGSGTALDWVVEMDRFDEDRLFDRLAARGALDLALMWPLGMEIARVHHGAERRTDHGGVAGMRWVIDGNAVGYAREGAGILDPAIHTHLTESARAEVARHGPLLEARRHGGDVRQCHGDLHLRNIVLLGQRPTLFDGVEFNDEISCVDVLYDLAFLLMDLWRRGLRAHANAVLNAYLGVTQDQGLSLLPLFVSCRAAVRAKTSATAATLHRDGEQRASLEALARDHLALAGRLLQPSAARVIAIGGVSGTGKTTLARALAPSIGRMPGAVIVRSDEIRKGLAGVNAQTRLGDEAYLPEMNRRVYASLAERVSAIARSGQCVIADAVFASAVDRDAVAQAASDADVRFDGLWLDAPDAILAERLRDRRGDVSDADVRVLQMQRARPADAVTWPVLDVSGAVPTIAEAAGRLLNL